MKLVLSGCFFLVLGLLLRGLGLLDGCIGCLVVRSLLLLFLLDLADDVNFLFGFVVLPLFAHG